MPQSRGGQTGLPTTEPGDWLQCLNTKNSATASATTLPPAIEISWTKAHSILAFPIRNPSAPHLRGQRINVSKGEDS
jgi:hypothetical protein